MNFAASPVLELTLPVWRSRFLLFVFVAGFGLYCVAIAQLLWAAHPAA